MAYTPKANEKALQVDTRGAARALREIGVPLAAIKQANKESAYSVLVEAKKLAPVSQYRPLKPGGAKYKSGGALRDSIRIADLSTSVRIRAGMARIPYANPVHWGWFRDKRTGIRRNILPNPWMARALGYTREEIMDNYVRNMNNLIAKHKARPSDLPL
jgi:hypothetical protein